MQNLDPSAIVVSQIYDGRRYCVYEHYADGLLFYVGSGQIARAFEFEPTRRCPAWHQFAAGRAVTVVVVLRSNDRNAMRRAEYERINRCRPIGNEALEIDQPLEWRTVRHGALSVATIIDRMTVVLCEPGGYRFPSVQAASKAMGISPSAIYNSISGRHSEVRGRRFSRIEIPLPRS